MFHGAPTDLNFRLRHCSYFLFTLPLSFFIWYDSIFQVWAGPLTENRVAVALWNRCSKAATITAAWGTLGLESSTSVSVRDLWKVRTFAFIDIHIKYFQNCFGRYPGYAISTCMHRHCSNNSNYWNSCILDGVWDMLDAVSSSRALLLGQKGSPNDVVGPWYTCQQVVASGLAWRYMSHFITIKYM